MKISYNIVLAAFLGTITHQELVAAVEFIPDIHHEGVVMLKDLGYDSRNGYPYQSFAEPKEPTSAGSTEAPVQVASGAGDPPVIKVADMSKEPSDKDIKLPKVGVEVKKPVPKEEEDKTEEVEKANAKKAEELEKEKTEAKKADVEAGKAVPIAEAMSIMEK